MSGATNEVGAPETGLRFREPVLTPQADDLYPVLGLVVTARRYPIIARSKITDRRSCFASRNLNVRLEPRAAAT